MKKPQIGDPMPAFELPDGEGRLVRSQDLLGRGPLVVFFYPKDDTMGCTVEACAFRDQHEEFLSREATVVGISADPPDSHARFAAKHRLPFPLLADTDERVTRAFGVTSLLGILRGRETFVVDRAGVIRGHIDTRVFPRKHVTDALAQVRRMTGGASYAAADVPPGAPA